MATHSVDLEIARCMVAAAGDLMLDRPAAAGHSPGDEELDGLIAELHIHRHTLSWLVRHDHRLVMGI